MTIAIAIRTETAVVFAADSKVTTRGPVGFDENREAKWLTQTYDNATKVVHSRRGDLLAVVTGNANIGQVAAADLIAAEDYPGGDSVDTLEANLKLLIDRMVERKRSYFSSLNLEPESWPGPVLLLAAPTRGPEPRPAAWRLDLSGPEYELDRLRDYPRVWLEGACDNVFTLLYGWANDLLDALCNDLELPVEDAVAKIGKLGILRPVDKINVRAMPIQDAVDLAVFLADVQVQMDRFLPGVAACGGAIDVMVLETSPWIRVLEFPGKSLQHPRLRGAQ